MTDKQDTPRMDSVICPNCAHQFQAISMDHQAELTALRASIEEARRELPEEPIYYTLTKNGLVKEFTDKACAHWVTRTDYDALRAKLAAVTVERDALNKLLLEGRVYICWAWAKKLATKERDAGNVRDCLNRINDAVKEPPAYSKPFTEDVP